jgi:anti-anti-sigma factor
MSAVVRDPRSSLRAARKALYGGFGQAGGTGSEVGQMGEAVMTTRRQSDGVLVVDVRGTLDAATVDALRAALLSTLQTQRPDVMIVDLTFVTFMDSMGIGALVTGYNAAREVGSRFVLRNPSEFVHRQLRVTGLAEMFGLSGAAGSPQSHQS